MIRYTLIIGLILGLLSCEERTEEAENSRGIPGPEKVEAESPGEFNHQELAEELKEKGHKVFMYEEGDTSVLMQQYYMVFLKEGPNRNQDSAEVAELQKLHLAHLSRMADEGYAGLVGPFEDDSDISGIVVFSTPTEKEADSLARLDPMVRAGRLEVEVHPWWTAKGGKLP